MEPEDQNIRDAVICIEKPGNYSVEAQAGGGKTQLSMDFMEMNDDKKITYITFTRAGCQDARKRQNGSNHEVKTFNSFCLSVLRAHNINVPSKEETVSYATSCGIVEPFGNVFSRFNAFTEEFKDALLRWDKYDKSRFFKYFKYMEKNKQATNNAFNMHLILLFYHLKIVKDISTLGYALIIDEAQDLDPFHLEIIKMLPFQIRIFVGDPKQAIYGFEGRVNLFKHAFYNEMVFNFILSTTFRFSQNVCDMIYGRNVIFSSSKNETDIKYWSLLRKLPTSDTVYLVPTNNKIVTAVDDYLLSGGKAYITEDRCKCLRSHYQNWKRFETKFKRWMVNKNFEDIYKLKQQFSLELKRAKNYLWIYSSNGWSKIDNFLMHVESKRDNRISIFKGVKDRIVFDTIHAYKGREEVNVIIPKDCLPQYILHCKTEFEKHCLYNVALTRATGCLWLNDEMKDFQRPFDIEEEVEIRPSKKSKIK
jgi:superfamily I DNA/RNA helicase